MHIWRSLVDDPRKAVDEHFGAIMGELLREMGGRLWRNRQAACTGMADLLQVWGREVWRSHLHGWAAAQNGRQADRMYRHGGPAENVSEVF